MITFSSIRVYQQSILDAIMGSRLSYGSNSKSDSLMDGDELVIGPEDKKFLQARITAGVGGENKFLRCIPVSVFILAPLRWWVDMDTYKVGTVRQSSSLMHYFKSRGELTAAQFTSSTDPRLIDIANEKYRSWIASGGGTNFTSREWEEFQDSIPRGFLYTSQWCGSYAVLANIYRQRRAHRQKEWRSFCMFIECLPHSWLMTTLEKKGK